MDSHQPGIPACQVDGHADHTGNGKGQPGTLAVSVQKQREQEVQKQNAAQEPFAHTGKILPYPSGGDCKVIQAQNGQNQRHGSGTGIVSRPGDKTDGKTDDPGQPEHGIYGPDPLFIESGGFKVLGSGVTQRSARNDEKQGGAKVAQINTERQRTGKQFVGQGEVPGHRGIEMDDKNADQSHSADEIQIKKPGSFHSLISLRESNVCFILRASILVVPGMVSRGRAAACRISLAAAACSTSATSALK